jgi:hypothetical protein
MPIFRKNGITNFFNILLIVSLCSEKKVHVKNWGLPCSFRTTQSNRLFWSEFRTRVAIATTMCYQN